MVALPRLRLLRQRRLLTIEQLAERANVNKNTISRIENGADAPQSATIRKLAAALDVEPTDLMGPER
jgi:transcriptional regulator with XRE-family HTH domain